MIIKLNYKTFEEGIRNIELIVPKKYSNQQKELYYKLIGSELNDEEYLNTIYNLLKTHKFSTLPTPADILETSKLIIENKKEKIYYEIKNIIRKMTRNSNIGYRCQNPLIHIVVDKLGGIEKLASMESKEVDYLLNKELRKMIDIYSDGKESNINLILANKNSEFIIDIGEKKGIEYWQRKYLDKKRLKKNE